MGASAGNGGFPVEEERRIEASGEDFWGDQIGPRHNYMRVVYNNVNGLRIGDYIRTKHKREKERQRVKALTRVREPSKLTGVISALRRWKANVVCCAESQTAWELHYVREMVAAAIRSEDRYATMIGSSSSTVTCEAYKPGGTLTIVDGNWSGRANKCVDKDKLGRWSIITLKGRNRTCLTIITAYRCCDGVTIKNVGTTSAFFQQEAILKERGISKSPQEMFIVDLIKVIQGYTEKGHEVLLNVDANETWDHRGSRIYDLAMQTGLYDIARERHGGPVTPTYVRKNCSRRIDYMLGSEGVLRNTRAIGIANETYDPVMGDHRPQYIDIDVNSLLQLHRHDIESPSARKLKSSNPRCVAAYMEKLGENFVNHNIYDRMESLWTEMEGKVVMTAKQVDRYEALDRDIFRLCKNAENNICSVKRGRYMWSPALDSAMKVVKYWKLRKKYINEEWKTEQIKAWGNGLGIYDGNSVDEAQISIEIEQARKALVEVQKRDRDKRVEFLSTLAAKYAEDHNTTHETAVRDLMSHEETRELFREIRMKMVGTRSAQISEVWTMDDENCKHILNEHSAVEDHLLHRNKIQLRQASSTPFADGTLGDLLHFDGTGEVAEKILKDEYFPEMEYVSDTAKKYIKGMAMRSLEDANTVDVNITLEQYKNFWKHKRESTVTSPFGLHIGHYRSCLGIEFSDALDVHRKMLLLPFKFAYVPERWAQTVQILLEKDSGAPWTHRLRIIELFDSQLNAGLQIIFGKRMVRNALDRGLIHPSTYGSIPNRTAQDAAIEKLWSLDMIRTQRISGAIFDCDAKGCYDRIIAALQTITCRRWGVPRTTALFFARLWRVCKHFIRTRFGTSDDFYMASCGEMLYGIGQGNGAGPAFWLTNLVVMFVVLESMCSGMGFTSPWRKLVFMSSGLGYVDDVTLGVTLDDEDISNDEIVEAGPHEEARVIDKISEIGQIWEEMLYTNGGRLELKKCHWMLLTWKWVRGVAYLKGVEESPAAMKITQSENGDEVLISRTSISDAPRILGCHISATGRWDHEYGRWYSEGARFASKIKQAKFRRVCGESLYTSLWLSKLRYVSPVVSFTAKQAARINDQVVFQCLPVSGYNRHFPRSVVYGPPKYGGKSCGLSRCWRRLHCL